MTKNEMKSFKGAVLLLLLLFLLFSSQEHTPTLKI